MEVLKKLVKYYKFPGLEVNLLIPPPATRVASMGLDRPQRGPYTGRGARTGGLVSDRTH